MITLAACSGMLLPVVATVAVDAPVYTRAQAVWLEINRVNNSRRILVYYLIFVCLSSEAGSSKD